MDCTAMGKDAVLAPAGTVTVAGTVTASVLELARLTTTGAAATPSSWTRPLTVLGAFTNQGTKTARNEAGLTVRVALAVAVP